MNVVRAVSSEGFGRIKYHTKIRGLLDTDRSVRGFMEGETTVLPEFYRARIRKELGPLYQYLPEGALMHDQNAYLHSEVEDAAAGIVAMRPRAGRAAAPAA